MTTLALLLIFPLCWPFVAKLIWKHELTFAEVGANLAIGALVVTLGWALGKYGQTWDTEILNGAVTSKYSERVSCAHSYECNCYDSCSGSGDKRTCTRVCSTCYEHSYDVDWVLDTTVGNITIDRVDRQGTQEPLRFSRAAVDDPVARSSSFVNYIKAVPESLFNASAEASLVQSFAGQLPTYPSHIHDYHYVNRVLASGVSVPELSIWNLELAKTLRKLGPLKQANLVVVFTNAPSEQYANALRAAWLGGKKNDVVVVMGTPNYPSIEWVSVFSWSDAELFKVQLRDALRDLKEVRRDDFFTLVASHIEKGFVRKPMQDFAYLESQIEPPTWALVILVMLSIGASVLTSRFLAQNTIRTGINNYR